jgi:hypothetical protein
MKFNKFLPIFSFFISRDKLMKITACFLMSLVIFGFGFNKASAVLVDFNLSIPAGQPTETSIAVNGKLTTDDGSSVTFIVECYKDLGDETKDPLVKSSSSITKNNNQEFNFNIAELTPGTGYYFKIKNVTTGEYYPGRTEFATEGTASNNNTNTNQTPGTTNSNQTPGTTNSNQTPGTTNTNQTPGTTNSNQTPPVVTTLDNPLGGGVNDIPSFIQLLLKIVFTVGVPLVALAIVYSGFLFIQAQGNDAKLKKAKATLLYTLIGGAILLGAWIIASAIQGTVQELQ